MNEQQTDRAIRDVMKTSGRLQVFLAEVYGKLAVDARERNVHPIAFATEMLRALMTIAANLSPDAKLTREDFLEAAAEIYDTIHRARLSDMH